MGPHPDLQRLVGPCLIAPATNSSPRGASAKKRALFGRNKDQSRRSVSLFSYCNCCYQTSPSVATKLAFSGGAGPYTGAPLFSVTARGRSRNPSNRHAKTFEYPDMPSDGIGDILAISKLAIQAEGPPLILPLKKDGYHSSTRTSDIVCGKVSYHPQNSREEESTSTAPSDSTSTTSEDSTGSLPRIIKPRKRRKKDGKAIITLKPYQPLCYHYAETLFSRSVPNKSIYTFVHSPYCHCHYCVTVASPPRSPDFHSSSFENEDSDDASGSPFNSPARRWIPLEEGTSYDPASKFSVMSYNILCQRYATKEKYPHLDNIHREQPYRRKRIIGYIKHYSPDIVCLQEVETNQFEEFYRPRLASEYEGEFLFKSRHYTALDCWRSKVDGCAIFWKKDRFRKLDVFQIEFQKLAQEYHPESEAMLNRVAMRDNIALAVSLSTKSETRPERELLVCTTHLHWDPACPDVKVVQAMMMVDRLHRVRPDTPTIVCGDFNSLRNSGPIEYLTSGSIPRDHPDLIGSPDNPYDYGQDLERMSIAKGSSYNHSYQLSNAYPDEYLDFTNYTGDFKEVIDYIFYTKDRLKRLSVLEGISKEQMFQEEVHSYPTPNIPSDHIPIIAEFTFPH